MSASSPIICFGQQPCGFFPKRFLAAKIFTARRLQKEIGGEIVFFCHDSDHDPRETRTAVLHKQSGAAFTLNFEFENKWQRKFSPLFAKRVPEKWHAYMTQTLGNYVSKGLVEMFRETKARNAADFCLEMYGRMGLLAGVRVVRSGDAVVRRTACAVAEFFVDVEHEGEIVRARMMAGELKLHEGGDVYHRLPAQAFGKEQVSPTRDSRLRWMQSVVHCTHYVCGAGEAQYMNKADAPEIEYISRDEIERSDEAYTEI